MKLKKIFISIILVMLIFFSYTNPVQASLFSDDENPTTIEETIEQDDGGLFERIIAKMIRWYSTNSI